MKKIIASCVLLFAAIGCSDRTPISPEYKLADAAVRSLPSVKGEIYTIVQDQPEFPGGVQKMYKYVNENVNYPKDAQRNNIQGKVSLQFVVEANGTISNIVVKDGIVSGCDDEAKRIISQMPKWKPGKVNGKAVNTYYTMPISFRLE